MVDGQVQHALRCDGDLERSARAARVPVNYPEGAFVAGLLHDTGRLLIAVGLSDKYEEVLALHQHSGAPLLDCEQLVLGFTHPELSLAALAFWNLPEAIQTAVRDHHIQPVNSNPRDLPLSLVVTAADRYVNSIGVSVFSAAGQPPSGGLTALESLGLEPERLDKVLDDFAAEYAAMSPFFS
jgi:hypothetical protein